MHCDEVSGSLNTVQAQIHFVSHFSSLCQDSSFFLHMRKPKKYH